jgi:hypothetical protein
MQLKSIGTHKMKTRTVNYHKSLNRGEWAEIKLREVIADMPNQVVSDIGAGFGWFGPKIKELGLIWQPFDYVRKIEGSIQWDLNEPVTNTVSKPGFILLLEVLEHLPNPELAIKHISEHIEIGGFIAITTPNPFYSKSKFSFLFKNQLYAFQPKHLIEHHVFVPLPHVVEFYLEKHGFEILEFGVLGGLKRPKFRFKVNYFKDLLKYFIESLLSGSKVSKGDTQHFFARKVRQD